MEEVTLKKPYTIKYSLEKICSSSTFLKYIRHYVPVVSKIVTEGYHLLNLHILRLLEDGRDIPPLSEEYMMQFLRQVSYKNNKQGKKEELDDDIKKTKILHYDALRKGRPLLCRDYLLEPLRSAATEMETAVKNNIQIHFFKRQYKFLQKLYPDKDRSGISAIQDKLVAFTDPTVLDSKNWRCVPKQIEKNLAYDLQKYPERFLVPMYWMNKYKEGQSEKTFSLMPMRRGFIPCSMSIGTETLDDWFARETCRKRFQSEKEKEKDKERKKMFQLQVEQRGYVGSKRSRKDGKVEDTAPKKIKIPDEVSKCIKDRFWQNYLNFDILNRCGQDYRFGHYITTDGISLSVLFKDKRSSDGRIFPKKKPAEEKKTKNKRRKKREGGCRIRDATKRLFSHH